MLGPAAGADAVKLPVRHIAGGLAWGHDGSVWLTLRAEADNDRHRSVSEQLQGHEQVRSVLMALRSEYMILGLCEPVSALAVAGAMIEGVDPDRHRAWAGIVSATLARFDGQARWRRVQYLSIKLSAGGGRQLLGRAARAAEASVGVSFGLPAPPVRRLEIAERLDEADELIARLSGDKVAFRAATAEEMTWIYRRVFLRGVGDARPDDIPVGPFEVGELQLAAIAESAALLEGGDRHDAGRPRRHRRYLRVEAETEAGVLAVGYQCFAVMSAMPSGWLFPGGMGEWFPRAEELDFPVDWCARVSPVANATARKKISWQRKQLDGQVGEYGDASGPLQELDESIQALDDQNSALAANAAEPDLPTTMYFALWADNLRLLEHRAQRLKDLFEADRYAIHRPTGGQEALFEAMLPGSALPSMARHYTQFLLCRDLASGSPFSGTDIGDPRGLHIGFQLNGSSFRPVLLDPAWGPEVLEQGSSMGLLGEPGGGKSHVMKLIITGVLCRGGQVVLLDRTSMREYSRLARLLARWGIRAQIVDLDDPRLCLDPLRIFGDADTRRQRAVGFLTVLLGTSALEADGMELADAVGEVVTRPDGRMADVIVVLARAAEAGNAVAEEVARKLRIFARTPLGQVIFGDQPALQVGDADLIVFAAQGLNLPTKAQVTQAHLAKQLLPEQILAQALLYLVAAITRQVALADKDRFALGAFDEAWGITVNVEGEQLLANIAHDGRKQNAGLLLAGQDAVDFGTTTELPGLIPVRFVFRQGSTESAKRALTFLDVAHDPEVIQLLKDRKKMGVGRQPRLCLIRDMRNRVGLLQVAEAWTPALELAMDSNPKRVAAADRDAAGADGGVADADEEPVVMAAAPLKSVAPLPGRRAGREDLVAASPVAARSATVRAAPTPAGAAASGKADDGGAGGFKGAWRQAVAGATGQATRASGPTGRNGTAVRPPGVWTQIAPTDREAPPASRLAQRSRPSTEPAPDLTVRPSRRRRPS